jgi:hypothetical protein
MWSGAGGAVKEKLAAQKAKPSKITRVGSQVNSNLQ